jgi:hypothetical protein
MGTTNHTKKYTTRKKQLLVEFVNVLKKHNRSKYKHFLVKISEVPPLYPFSFVGKRTSLKKLDP